MSKKFFASLSIILLSISSLYASRFGEGFGVGAFTGLVGGMITSKIAAQNTPPPVFVYEDPYAEEKRAELRFQQEQLRAACLEQRRRERALELQRRQEEHYAREVALKKEYHKQLCDAEEFARAKAKTLSKVQDLELKKRELALKEQQTKLALVQEQKEFLKEQNRQTELALKEKELDLKLLQAQQEKDTLGLEEKLITKKYQKKR